MSYEDQLIREATGQGRDFEQGEEDDGNGQYECAECGSTYHPSSECPDLCVFIDDWPRRGCYQCGKLREDHQ